MTGPEFEAARRKLGLTAAQLGRKLELEGRDPGQQVRRWETGAVVVSGPVRVAVRYMLAEHAQAKHAARIAAAALKTAEELRDSGFVDLIGDAQMVPPDVKPKARRRG